ncbi:MAG: LacI family DNA-binding transcriptional regulator [Burkholderiales bacterium]|nr:LacI family DNA-binding transcriptional regulator [Burkholderiales bacterium]
MKNKRAENVKSGPVTLERVAKLAGVSPSTVSRILNGTAVVSDEKRKAIDEAIAELGFIPNPVARGLAGGRTLSIGVVTQAIDSPFYGPALRGIEDELDSAGYSPLFVSAHWNPVTEGRCIDVLRSRRVDGLIVLNGRLSDQALKNTAKHLPIVVTGRNIKGTGIYALNFDNFAGGVLATEHLISLGHRKIAFIAGDAAHPDANERFRGYTTALKNASITFDSQLVVSGDYQVDGGLNATDQLLSSRRKFTALFAANDQMAYGAALSLHRKGLKIPEDVSLIGFDDLYHSIYVAPPLSTIHQPAYELGRLTASAILQMLADTKPTAFMPAPKLIVRESTAKP